MAARRTHRNVPTCNKCGAAVLWATTATGERQPLDPKPNQLGSVIGYRDALGVFRARANNVPEAERHPLEKVYMVHFATCPGKPEAALPDNVTPIHRPQGGSW